MFQKKVPSHLEIPEGFPGQLAEADIAARVGCISISDTKMAKPGDFIMGEVDNASKRFKYAKVASGNVANKVILGVVLRASQKNAGILPLPVVQNNSQVMYLMKGSVYITTTSDATSGQYVFLKEADASLVFDNAATKQSHLFTGFRVVVGGKANTIIMIQSV